MESIMLGHIMSFATLMAEKPAITQKIALDQENITNQFQNLMKLIELGKTEFLNQYAEGFQQILDYFEFFPESDQMIVKFLDHFTKATNEERERINADQHNLFISLVDEFDKLTPIHPTKVFDYIVGKMIYFSLHNTQFIYFPLTLPNTLTFKIVTIIAKTSHVCPVFIRLFFIKSLILQIKYFSNLSGEF